MNAKKQGNASKVATTQENIDLLIAEYSALREEVVKRIEIEHQLISLALIAPGTLLAVGFQTNNASLMLLYPVLAFLLSAVWLANAHHIHNTAAYIREAIESVSHGSIGWQSVKASSGVEPFHVLGFFASRLIFIATELLAILAGITIAKFDTDTKEIRFLIIGAIFCFLTVGMIAVVETFQRRGKKNLWPYGPALAEEDRSRPSPEVP